MASAGSTTRGTGPPTRPALVAWRALAPGSTTTRWRTETSTQDVGISVDHTSGIKISNITEGDGTDGLDMYHSRNASVTGSHFGYRDHGNFDSGASLIGAPNLTISNS